MNPDQHAESVASEPSPIDLVHQIREALGWPVVALPVTPQKAFEDCLWQIRFLREENDLLRGAVPGALSRVVGKAPPESSRENS